MSDYVTTSSGIASTSTHTPNSVNLLEYKDNQTSQAGENGVIAKIFEVIGTTNKACVEFGGYDLKVSSNIYPLWRNEGWSGILIEGNKGRHKKMSAEFAKMNGDGSLRLNILNHWVSPEGPESLDNILAKTDTPTDYDLCSIDVDSVDYHIWDGVQQYTPRVVIIEFNPTVPPHITVIGKKSGNYIGASISAMLELGNRKGYDLVAITRGNALFVRKEESAPFMHKNDVDTLFNPAGITYVISSFDGGVCFSRRPNFGDATVSRKRFRMEDDNGFYFPTLGNYIMRKIRYFIRYKSF